MHFGLAIEPGNVKLPAIGYLTKHFSQQAAQTQFAQFLQALLLLEKKSQNNNVVTKRSRALARSNMTF